MPQLNKEETSAENLFESYAGFGENPWIVGGYTKPDRFEAWNYAKQRSEEFFGRGNLDSHPEP